MKRLVVPLTDAEAEMIINRETTTHWLQWLLKFVEEHAEEVIIEGGERE